MSLPLNIKRALATQVPACVFNEISSFVFFDNHPLDGKSIDVTTLTKDGVLMEIKDREIITSLCLQRCLQSCNSELSIFRNSRCELFYLITFRDELFVISSGNKLEIKQSMENIENYEVVDSQCHGFSRLQVLFNDDAVPITFDDDMNPSDFRAPLEASEQGAAGLSDHLHRKIIAAKYSVASNESKMQEYVKLRHETAFELYKAMFPSLSSAAFQDDFTKIPESVRVKIKPPWIKIHDGRAIVILDIENENDLPLEDPHTLLQVNTFPSVTYTSLLYQRITTTPYWKETSFISGKSQSFSLVTILELQDIAGSSFIEMSGIMAYKENGVEKYLPIKNIKITCLQSVSEEIQVLSHRSLDNHDILALMAVSTKTDLTIRYLGENFSTFEFDALLCRYLELIQIKPKLLVYKKSPYHALYGLMIFIEESFAGRVLATVYSRNENQLVTLTKTIQDIVPKKIIITTRNIMISSKNDKYLKHNEELPVKSHKKDWLTYGSNLLKLMDHIKQYYDSCFVEMSKSKDETVLAKIGKEIDLYAYGDKVFEAFKRQCEDLMREGAKGLCKEVEVADSESMEW